MGRIEVTVNGRSREVAGCGIHTNLLDWLRSEGLTGAKEGCAEGECGACAVLVARPDPSGGTRWTSVNACLPPVLAFDGQEVVTAEGLGTAEGAGVAADMHPVQREMVARGGSQCGYCTPGFVCSMAAEYYRPDRTSAAQGNGSEAHGPNGFDLHALSGNLCRCTGYRPIRDAAYALEDPDDGDPLAARRTRPAPPARATRRTVADTEFVRPATLRELLDMLAEYPDATVVAGATDVGVELNLRHARPSRILAVDRLEELRGLRIGAERIEIGAGLTLSEIERGLAGRVPLLAALFPMFASRLIRNGATLGGNLGTASPIGDAPPVLLALDASLVLAGIDLAGRDTERTVALADYFTGYRHSVKEAGEIIRTVQIPLPLADLTAFHKIAKRRFDDISSVAIGIAARVEGGVVDDIRIGLGGVAATAIRALATEDAVRGRAWEQSTITAAAAILAQEGTPLDDHRASARYRSAMLKQSLLRFYADNEPSQTLVAPR